MSETQKWEVAKIEVKERVYEKEPLVSFPSATIIKFKNGKELETNLVRFKLIDVIYSKDNIAFMLFSGADCTECDMAQSIYVHAPEKGDFKRPDSNIRYVYPGKINYYMDQTPLFESRMFYGQCLNEETPVVVWYGRKKDEQNTWKSFVQVIEFNGNKVVSRLLPVPLLSINKSIGFVKTGKCKELPGYNRSSEP